MSITENKSYTAVTIGPIGYTMSLITKPAALWTSSYVFSYISRMICEKAAERVGAQNIVSPFFPDSKLETEKELFGILCERKDGVGLFHDRIIVLDNGEFFNHFKEIRSAVIKEVSELFEVSIDYLNSYIMIKACNYSLPASSGSNAIMYSSKMLDCMELSKTFVSSETRNELLSSLSNEKVKKIGSEKLCIDEQSWQLMKNKAIRDIPDICASANANGFKKNGYYCILRSDGDNMGKLLSRMKTDEECRSFSRVCLEYCNKIAKAVGEYGGLTVYAGGDDLFALVPTEGIVDNRRKNIFHFIGKINSIFQECFKNYISLANTDKPSLSFGVLICHKKHPLFEAVERSGSLLFGVAKNGGKNCVAVQLQKHSGQSEEIVIANSAVNEVAEKIDGILGENSEEYLLSAANKIIRFEKLIDAVNDNMIFDLFKNLFDADYHIEKNSGFLHEELPKMFKDYCKTGQVALYEEDERVLSSAKALGQLLRLMKFFIEKGLDVKMSKEE